MCIRDRSHKYHRFNIFKFSFRIKEKNFIISKKKEEVCFDRAKNAANEKFGKEEDRVLDIISYMRDEELDTWEDGRTIAHFNRELIRIKTKKRLFTKNIMNHFIENYFTGTSSLIEGAGFEEIIIETKKANGINLVNIPIRFSNEY